MSDETNSSSSCGCGGCVGMILTILVLCALWFGLPTTWGTLEVDLLPPAIRLEK